MNTREFFSLLLPSSGIKYVATLDSFTKDGKAIPFFKHYDVSSPAEASARALGLDEEAQTVYFALAGYAEPAPSIDPKTGLPRMTAGGKPKFDMRTQALATHAKAFWMDIDCGEEKADAGKGYRSKKDAARAVGEFCQTIGLGLPLMVDSGGGLHCYWPLDKDIPAAQWASLAPVWRALIVHFGVKSDPARDMDIASVLRPVGTHNRKNGELLVRAINPANFDVSSPRDFAKALLTAELQFKPVKVAMPTAPKQRSKLDDMGETKEYPPSSAKVMVLHCNQVLQFHQRHGDVDEPTWRAMLGLLKHTIEGDTLAHEWSSGHPAYDATETQEKLDRWALGPTTCKHFETCAPNQCTGCGHKGKVTSPIQLGYTPAAPAEPKVIEPKAEQVEAPVFKYPEGYQEHGGGIAVVSTNADGMNVFLHFSNVQFYPVARIRKPDGKYAIRFANHKADGRINHFEIDASVIASAQLVEALAAYEVYTPRIEMKKHLQQYALTVCQHHARRAREVRAYESMGWQEGGESFVLGNRVYKRDGSSSQALLTRHAASRMAAFEGGVGSAVNWAEGIDIIYNREGAEPFQYAICSAFGSLLGTFKIDDNYKGIPVALTDEKSGQGKSTVCQNALRAFGDPTKMMISTQQGATHMARMAVMAGMGNIPLLLDELTHVEPQALSDFLYAASNGQDRIRMTAGGQLQDPLFWNMSVFITANENLTQKLELFKENSEAEMVRIFEINIRQHPLPVVPRDDFEGAMKLLMRSNGGAGEQFIQYLLKEESDVRQRMQEFSVQLRKALPFMEEQRYRFYRIHAECTLTAAAILHRLNLVKFDLDGLYAWVVKHLWWMCRNVSDATVSTQSEAIHRMISEFGPRILVTNGYRDRKDGCEDPLHAIRDNPVGRHVAGQDAKTEAKHHGKLYLDRAAVKHWCAENRVNLVEMIDRAVHGGYMIKPNEDRISLGRGTYITTGQTRVLIVDMKKLTADSPLKVVPKVDDNAAKGAEK